MKKNAYTILIICEGENTEPYYFQGIRDKIITQNVWLEDVNITIRPEPQSDTEAVNESRSKYKSDRKRRHIEEEPIKGSKRVFFS